MQCMCRRQDFALMAGSDGGPWHGKPVVELGESRTLHCMTGQYTRIWEAVR